ncbi:MAG: hypothetical protein KDA49_14300 [Rhodospirillaceae bacterium]|nr:hypothetical protein [Rhodospirillaceae bacterium]
MTNLAAAPQPTAVRIAMWSGPRNISTALMRAWENRPDTWVVDEPFYAHYLAQTGLDHPGRADVIASQPTDWRAVVADLTGPVPEGRAIYYQKHMAHHLLPDMGRDWLAGVTNCFLVRDPARVLTSYAKVRGEPTLADTGLPQQLEIFRRVQAETGRTPPVIDADEVLADPAAALAGLCAAVGVAFEPCMLAWPAGPRATDGVWATHWYAGVIASTGFAAPPTDTPDLPARLRPLADECAGFYAELRAAG